MANDTWDSVVVETARKHPMAVAAWLVADATVNTATRLQEAIETRMRAALEDSRPA
jgi:hypothetical protein